MTKRNRAFAMVEVVLSTLIVGGLAVAALSMAATSAQFKASASHLAEGRALCRMLAEEIAAKPVADWSTGGMEFYMKAGTVTVSGDDRTAKTIVGMTGKRSNFNIIDDYDGYTDSPPEDINGDDIPGFDGWTRRVTVSLARFGNPGADSLDELGLRRVTVTAEYGGKTIATTTFLRSSEWEAVMP